VNKLSEGWDVDNVFQIVPMEERVFNSKLLISQVLGRGMRIPRDVPNTHIQQHFPVLTVTNHDKFADHIKELVDSVTESDMYLASTPLTDREQGRGAHNFTVFNLNYIPSTRFEKADQDQGTKPPGKLTLTPFEEKLGVKVIRTKDEKRYELARDFCTVDEIVYDIYKRFSLRTFEALHFDFGSVVVDNRHPEEDEIRQVILDAMKNAGITGNKLSEDNRKQIDIYFSQFLPPGKKKRVFENIEGDIDPIPTFRMDRSGIRVSELERDRAAFLSEDHETEVGGTNKFVLDYINELRRRPEDGPQLSLFKPEDFVEELRRRPEDGPQLSLFKPEDFVESRDEIIRPFVKGDTRPPYVVNTSKLKSPQNIVLVSHSPEKEFVFQLIDNSDYIDSWIKSPDKNFYSIQYEYWKGGKDRVRRSFNPDFFIRLS
jgi:type III restriction enzyme